MASKIGLMVFCSGVELQITVLIFPKIRSNDRKIGPCLALPHRRLVVWDDITELSRRILLAVGAGGNIIPFPGVAAGEDAGGGN